MLTNRYWWNSLSHLWFNLSEIFKLGLSLSYFTNFWLLFQTLIILDNLGHFRSFQSMYSISNIIKYIFTYVVTSMALTIPFHKFWALTIEIIWSKPRIKNTTLELSDFFGVKMTKYFVCLQTSSLIRNNTNNIHATSKLAYTASF